MPSVGGTHDIRIGDNYYLIQPGSYNKRAAPLFGARFTTGDPDYNNLNFWQHWVQSCWVGGFGARDWVDDAMFDEGVGIDASQHEVMTLSRDLGPATRGSWLLDNALSIKKFSNFGGVLYCLATGVNPGKLYRYNHAGNTWGGAADTWSHVKTFTEVITWMEPFAGAMVFGDSGSSLNKMTQNTTTGVLTWSTINKPSGRTEVVYMMKQYRSKLYVGIGRFIYRLKKDFTWDGSTFFYEADDINYINQMEVHLGFLYMASRNGHILRTDGNNTFDLWQFENHVSIWHMRSFDGRLFIGAAEEIEGTSSAQTVIYQFSGAAVTELKRWGKVGYDTTPGKFYDIDRSLFFGASNLLGMGDKDGFGIARYDPVEDGFHLFASNQDIAYTPGTEGVNNQVGDIAYFKGRLYCSTRRWGVFHTPWTFRDVSRYQATYDTTPAGASTASKNGGWYESSDFDGGTPGLRKLWNAITVHVDLPTTDCSVYVEVSKDGGGVWYSAGGSVAAATITKTTSATRYSKTIILQDTDGAGINGWFSTRLKYRITLRTTNTTRSPQLRGVIVRYLPIPEPQWQWDFTLVLSDRQELHDGTVEERDIDALVSDLQAKFRNQELVEFQDVDGTIWSASGEAGVLLFDFQMRMPYIGPSPDGDREMEIRLSIMEAVNLY